MIFGWGLHWQFNNTGSDVSWPALSTRHCLQVLSGLRCLEGPELTPPLWRGCYSENNSLSFLKSPLLPAHLMNGIRHRLAYSEVRNITGKYKESVCLSLRRERFSEILLFFWCSLCPGDGWEARSVSGQSRLRDFSRKEKHPWAALRLSAPVAQPHMLVVASKVSSQARAARLKKSREKELHLRQQLQAASIIQLLLLFMRFGPHSQMKRYMRWS